MVPLNRLSQTSSASTRRARGPSGFHFRPVRANDRERLLAFYRSLDEDTLYSRFGCLGAGMIQEEVQRLTGDGEVRLSSLVATSGRKIVAVGYYCQGEEPDTAEVAFIVHPRYRRHGIATFMLRRLERDIRRQGFTSTSAQVESTNAPMKEVFADVLGKPQESKCSCGQLIFRWANLGRTGGLRYARLRARHAHPKLVGGLRPCRQFTF